MSFAATLSRHGTTLTIQRASTTTDGFHNTVPGSWAAHGDPVTGIIQPDTSTEDLDQRTTTVTRYRAFLPDGTDVTAADRISDGTTTFEVDGEPERWTIGRNPHVEARLKVVAG